MNPLKASRVRMLVVAGMVLLALPACGGNDPDQDPVSSPPPSLSTQDNRQAWLAVAKCMREHGFPNFPDPVQNDRGVWSPASDTGDDPTPPECDQLFRTAKQATSILNGPSAQEMSQLRAYAKCMREHGIPGFPDPDEEGNFDLPENTDDATLDAGYGSCRQLRPPPRPK